MGLGYGSGAQTVVREAIFIGKKT